MSFRFFAVCCAVMTGFFRPSLWQVSLARCVQNNLHSHVEFIKLFVAVPPEPPPPPQIFLSPPAPQDLRPLCSPFNPPVHNLIKPPGLGAHHHLQWQPTFGSHSDHNAFQTTSHPIDCINVFLQNYCLPSRAPAYHKLCKWKNANRKTGPRRTTILN